MTAVDGRRDIPIEERDPAEVRFMEGMLEKGIHRFRIMPDNSPVSNYGFDVTPARLVTGLITEKGICLASENSIMKLMESLA